MAVEAATGLPAIMGWPLSRKITLAVAALISIAIFALIIIQARVADYRLLYANLASSDASWMAGRRSTSRQTRYTRRD